MIIRCFLPTNNINKIDLCITGIKIYFYYFAPYICQKHFNILKSVLCVEMSTIGQIIILNKSVISQKRSLVTSILNSKYDKVMRKTFNARSQNMKV